MPRGHRVGKPTTRRYSMEEKAAAVRMVRLLRAETGMTTGAVRQVADQVRSSEAMFPAARGTKGHPLRPQMEASSTAAPCSSPTIVSEYPVLRVWWRCRPSGLPPDRRATSGTSRRTCAGTSMGSGEHQLVSAGARDLRGTVDDYPRIDGPFEWAPNAAARATVTPITAARAAATIALAAPAARATVIPWLHRVELRNLFEVCGKVVRDLDDGKLGGDVPAFQLEPGAPRLATSAATLLRPLPSSSALLDV